MTLPNCPHCGYLLPTATLRDQFAMAALTQVIVGRYAADVVARIAYDFADAMMKVRSIDTAPKQDDKEPKGHGNG